MRQTGHWGGEEPLTPEAFRRKLEEAVGRLDVDQARRDVAPFVRQPESLDVWSHEFFLEMPGRIRMT